MNHFRSYELCVLQLPIRLSIVQTDFEVLHSRYETSGHA